MRKNIIIRLIGFAFIVLFAGGVYSCADDISVGKSDDSKFDGIGKVFAYLRNAKIPNSRIIDLYSNGDIAKLTVGLTAKVGAAVDFKIDVDHNVLATYNAANGTDFDIFPAELVTIDAGGNVVVPPGYLQAEPVGVNINYSADLVKGKSYALPISIKSATEGVQLEGQSNYIYIIKPQGDRLNPAKNPDIKIVSCQEVNDANPLTNGELYLKNSGKPFVDIVVLFSANINLNTETGRVYVWCNPNVRTLLDNRQKYLVPLQEKGIKVVLGILGNWDKAGLANLTDETARYFAQELKAYCDAYELDGVFFDDEYSSYAPGPGFVYPPNLTAASRLVYETKRAMPDKLMLIYIWGTYFGLLPVDNIDPGNYVDYILADYGRYINLDSFPGVVKKQAGPYSSQCNHGNYPSDASLNEIRTEGYGAHMLFALDEAKSFWSSYTLNNLNRMARVLFDDEIMWTGVKHKKDW